MAVATSGYMAVIIDFSGLVAARRQANLTWVSWTKLCERMSLGKELGYAEEEA
jgi:hypothetical protein